MKFYLGTHLPTWLWQLHDTPLFVSHRVLRNRKSPYPKATTTWALDSGGFTELALHGRWTITPEEYIAAVRRYRDQLGRLEWAAPQDWNCDPDVLKETGLTIAEHQRRTVDNYLHLTSQAPDLPFVPVLQGWDLADYLHHLALYGDAGIDLTTHHTVGVGSACKRPSTAETVDLFDALAEQGLQLHGFGVKVSGLSHYAEALTSADSMSWSYGARRSPPLPGCTHNSCNNCVRYALRWRERVLTAMSTPSQPRIPMMWAKEGH